MNFTPGSRNAIGEIEYNKEVEENTFANIKFINTDEKTNI